MDNKTKYSVFFQDFEYKGHKSNYLYYLPFEAFIEGVRSWFNDHMINIDGKDNDIWNTLVEFDDVFDEIEFAKAEWFREHYREDAFEEFKEQVEDDIEDEREEAEYQAKRNAEYDDID